MCFIGYEKDFFDLIIVDECHRGGANDESTWRGILDYFSPAVQLGLTATPKRDVNVDTYKYFGNPVYTYSLKDGIEHGFLTPFKVMKFDSNIDEYTYEKDDDVLDGEIDKSKTYKENEFNKDIQLKQREEHRVKVMLNNIKQNDKTLVFCANQNHASLIRDFINQHKQNNEVDYCVRVTADEGKIVRGTSSSISR